MSTQPSYDRADRAWAEWVAACLEDADYATILDIWNFRPGANFILEINSAIINSERTIAILSPDYLLGLETSPQWSAAFAQDPASARGRLLPVIVRECTIQGLLSQIIPIDLTELDEATAKKVLLEKIRSWYEKPPKFPYIIDISRIKFPKKQSSLSHTQLAYPATNTLFSDYVNPNHEDNSITLVFKTAFQSFSLAKQWIDDKRIDPALLKTAGNLYAEQLEKRYNSMRIMGMSQPIPLRSIYTRVNILKKIRASHRVGLEELEKFFDLDRRRFGRTEQTDDGILTINRLDKCIVLGKPGAGKTTFLKYLTLQALDGTLSERRVPIYISLKDWADSGESLKKFIVNQFAVCAFPDTEAFVGKLLESGSCILLLDGLDEVSTDIDSLIQQVRNLSLKYNANKFIISCRIAAYNYWFEHFADLECADFSDDQIKTFIQNWFVGDQKIADVCWQRLVEDTPIRELATIPLLLTLLCIAFDETLTFPKNKAELYKEAIDALLKKWDTSRRIKRENLYREISLIRKETMLSQIAAITFENRQYFFPQRTLEKYITEFMENITQMNPQASMIDSEAILKSIEAQHGLFVERAKGIYSFSHLTFQEYFTAKYIVDNWAQGSIQRLVDDHITEDRWSEVFFIVTGMLPKADDFILLMKASIDKQVNDNMASLLRPLQPKARSLKKLPYGVARIYALYRTLGLEKYYMKEAQVIPSTLELIQAILETLRVTTRNMCIELSRLLEGDARLELNSIPPVELDLDLIAKKKVVESLLVYIKANNLLLKCLNSECYITKKTRDVVLDTLLQSPRDPVPSHLRRFFSFKKTKRPL